MTWFLTITAWTLTAVAAFSFLTNRLTVGWSSLLIANGCFLALEIRAGDGWSLVGAGLNAAVLLFCALNLVRPRRRGGA